MSADAMPSARWVRVVGNTPWMSAVGLNATLPAEKKGDGTAGPPRRRPPPRPVFPPGQGSSAAPTLGCLLRALFAPSAWLAAAVEARRRELFGDSPFEGVHLRLGAGRGPDVAERCSREMRPRDAAEVDCSRLGIRRRDLAGRLEGPSHPASTPPLPRPGDGAAGTAFRPGTVPTTDRRMTVDGAVSVMRCLASAGSSPVFVATDNARLKAAILAGKRGGGGGGGSGGEEVALTRSGGGRLVLPPALAGRFRAQGCADCMVADDLARSRRAGACSGRVCHRRHRSTRCSSTTSRARACRTSSSRWREMQPRVEIRAQTTLPPPSRPDPVSPRTRR
mmetsp:Transcript_27759/g.89090  ORF Transcript_27759/g.89090 Transcript_27759/m.89090 type:complete len:335 (-) Transcript_27759:231-1235(-)